MTSLDECCARANVFDQSPRSPFDARCRGDVGFCKYFGFGQVRSYEFDRSDELAQLGHAQVCEGTGQWQYAAVSQRSVTTSLGF